MLGMAIPKRWVISLALVGLVSLFMASYSAVWAGPASATTGPANTTLSSIQSSTFSVDGNTNSTWASGAVFGGMASVTAHNSDGDDITGTAPGLTYSWSVTNSCLSFEHPSAANGGKLTASTSACTGVATVTVQQFGANTQTASFNVVVNGPALPQPTPLPVTNSSTPAKLPTGVDSNQVTEIKAGDGGSLSVDGGGGKAISLNVPGGSLGDGEAASVSIKPISADSVPSAPPAATEGASSGTFKFGSSVVQITWYDKDGAAQDTKKISKPAQVCMTYTQEDIDNADGGIDGLGIWRHNGTEWVKLNSTAYTNPNRICANTSNFSPFALGLDVAVPEAAGTGATGLPATGDYSPNAMTLIMAMFAGFALVATGVFTARRARRVREES